MYEPRSRNRSEHDMLVDSANRLERDVSQRERLAIDLSQEAMRQVERALYGALAAPAAVALGLAASVTWATFILERGLEVFEISLDRVRFEEPRRTDSRRFDAEPAVQGRIDEQANQPQVRS